jgi:6-phosphogluconolactonase (cycloisomerase 2 family)
MKFRKFGKTVLTAALSSAIVFSLSSCVRSFTAGYLYVTGTVTATPSGNGIISGFKINNNNGKLTTMHGLPVGSGGANPVRIVLLSGGNFVYVLNAGATASGSATCTTSDPCLNSNITEFAVGGNGILTYQNTFYSQGINPMRMLSDTSGTHLIVLDHDAPANTYCSAIITGATSCGDITVFTIDQTTGRLTLVTNAQLTTSAGTQVTYFPVQANPIDMATTSSYVMTLAGAASASPTAVVTDPTQGQTVYPYTYNASTGQLTTTQSVPQIINNGLGNYVGQATALVYAGSKMYVLDNEVLSNGVPGQILPFTIGTNGALQSLVGGAVADDSTQESPIYLIQDSKAKFIYVANQGGSSITNGAGIVGYTIDPSSSQLTENSGSPYIVGTGAIPVCLLEDPSNQYIYTANAGDSTVSGKLLDPNAGVLNPMQGWSGSIALNGPATWCVATGRTN